jgi:hypothetical protein
MGCEIVVARIETVALVKRILTLIANGQILGGIWNLSAPTIEHAKAMGPRRPSVIRSAAIHSDPVSRSSQRHVSQNFFLWEAAVKDPYEKLGVERAAPRLMAFRRLIAA